MKFFGVLLSLIRIFTYCFSEELFEGSSCTIRNSNNPGICKFITECPEARANIIKGIFPQTCGFVGSQIIVCCPIVTTTQTTTTMRITTTRNVPRVSGRIAKTKCDEYSKYVWEVETNPTFIISGSDIVTKECPFDREQLIVGGSPAQRKEFPHMVQIGFNDSGTILWGCGGSLISDKYVLTAAHCLEHLSAGYALYARMGITDLDDDDHLQQFDIAERIYHPEYEFSSHYNDIALIKLAKSVKLNSWVRPACIHTTYSIPDQNAIASGWGRTEFAGDTSQQLLKVVLELYSHQSCNRTFRAQTGTSRLRDGIRDDSMLCAGSSTDIKDTCQGDSGGPLQRYLSNGDSNSETCMYEIIGITSFGKGCGLAKDLPAVYTRVSHYLKWIEDIVWS